ncbi:MAG: N-acetylmuramoyl-L-alanine amidase [Clostridia bacterium]|nr:N-acetylmuramoyl-L-alanine amidase [Clostridia bacterium]
MEFKFLPLRHETIKEKEGRIMKIKKKITIVSLLILLFIAMMIIFIIIDSNKPVVCIDAGHGGEDVGAILEKRYEKDDTLKLAKRIKERLKKQGIKVIMTRENNNSISLEERCNLANRKKAELFVSIHRNSAEKGNGIEIWCNSQKKEKDTKLANSILEKLQKTEIQTDRGIKYGTIHGSDSDYYVLKNSNMPSCLIELGFITNQKDNQLFDDHLEDYAKAIEEGILENIENREN